MPRILLIRLSSFGDILLTTHAIRCIRQAKPNAHIDFLTRSPYVPLLKGNPHLNAVLPLEAKNIKELNRLRKKIASQYDIIVDFHDNWRSRFLTFQSRATVLRTPRYDFRRRALSLFKWNLLTKTPPLPMRHLALLAPLGVKDDNEGLEFFSSAEALMDAKSLIIHGHITSGSFVALSPGSRWPTKEWPPEKFEELIALLPQEKFVVLGGIPDIALGEKLVKVDPERVVSLCGKTSPGSAGEILRRAKALVTNDSGLLHMACAVQIPVVAVFGCTVKEFGFFPFRAKAVVLERPLACRPCATKGRAKCPKGTLECLTSISAEEAAVALEHLLSR